MSSALSVPPLIEVRRSGIHGTGVFTTQPLAKGHTVGVYSGRRYRADEIAARDWDHDVTYVFGLSDGSLIDGAEGGDEMRYLNHSCAPNCIAHEVEDAHGRLSIEIETLRRLPAGAELFLDYSLAVEEGDPADFPCHCGAPNCRGTLLAKLDAADE